MPLIKGTTTLTTGAKSTNGNELLGKEYNPLPFNAVVRFAAVADGGTGLLTMDVISGTDILARNAPVSNANREPVIPDDFYLTDVAGAGETLILALDNGEAATRIIKWAVLIDPLV